MKFCLEFYFYFEHSDLWNIPTYGGIDNARKKNELLMLQEHYVLGMLNVLGLRYTVFNLYLTQNVPRIP